LPLQHKLKRSLIIGNPAINLPEWITLTWWGGLHHQRMETKNSQNTQT
jgi:hypothetical protein